MATALHEPIANLECERCLAGAALLDSNCLDALNGKVTADDFHQTGHALIFDVVSKLHERGLEVDEVTVADAIKQRGKLADFADLPRFLLDLMEAVPHAAHAPFYAERVRDAAMIRRMVDAASTVVRAGTVKHTVEEVRETLHAAEQEIHRCIERVDETGETVHISELLMNALDSIGKAKQRGVPTGLPLLDKKTNGWQPGNLIILAARPSCGKTALAGNLAVAAARCGTPVAFFSMEQSKAELSERFLACDSHVSAGALKSGDIDEDQREMLLQGAARLSELKILIDDESGLTVSRIAGRARLWKRKHGIGLVIVDYLQIIEPGSRKDPREQQVAAMSRDLKRLARQLEVPVICLAQLNRSAGSRQDKTPILSDLRESGAIEQDANIVLFIHRDWCYDSMAPEGDAKLIVAKNRDGATGQIFMDYVPDQLRFTERGIQSKPTYFPTGDSRFEDPDTEF